VAAELNGGGRMNSSSATTMARAWADATPFNKFVEERAQGLAREGITPPRVGRSESGEPSAAERLAIYGQYQIGLMVGRDKAKADAINDFITGRIVGLGRRSNSYDIERIEPSFWIGANVEGDKASRDKTNFIEIRVVAPDAIPSVQPKSLPGPGRPSEVDAINLAIADYAKTDPALKCPPSVRYRAYRFYISTKGFDPRRDSGFSNKTFEKYEREYRRNFK
jgi:hypothetical protein